MKKLDDSQVKAFDLEYVDDDRWLPIKRCIERDFPDGHFTFLDIGGGNGVFCDRILAEYPDAQGTVLDNSEVLLARNAPSPRKNVLLKSAADISQLKSKYDLVFVNWVLHHLVGESYSQTRDHQLKTLRGFRGLLNSRGRVSIYENNYAGWLFQDLPGRLIFALTSSTLLSMVTRKMGANTAGIGVCFLSKRQWLGTINAAGMQLLDFAEPDKWTWPVRPQWRLFLHIRSIHTAHYWLAEPAA